jgi:hypothetical protein
MAASPVPRRRLQDYSIMVDWPTDTPTEVQQLADEIATMLKGKNGRLVGPAIALVFAYVVAELGNAPLKQVIRDVGALARRYGALKPQRPH